MASLFLRLAMLAMIAMAVTSSQGSAQQMESLENTPELRQPERLVPDSSDPGVTRLPPVPTTPAGLALPPWLLPDAPAELDGKAFDRRVQLATANVPVPRRAAALYAQAEKLATAAPSRENLTAIIQLCTLGQNSEPGAELELQLGRLAGWAFNLRGEMFIEDGDERAAFDDFSSAIRCDGNCWSAYHNRAITYATYGQREEALQDFAAAARLCPDAIEVYRNRAELYLQLGDVPAALDDLSNAIARSEHDGNLRSLRGDLYQRLGNPDRAAREYDAALERGCESVSVLAHRATLAAARGDYSQATVDYDTALARDPYHAATYRGVAWLLATCPDERFRDAAKALEAARRAQRFGRPNDPHVLDALAAAHASAGDYASAVQIAKQAAVLAAQPLRTAIEQRLELYRQDQPHRGR